MWSIINGAIDQKMTASFIFSNMFWSLLLLGSAEKLDLTLVDPEKNGIIVRMESRKWHVAAMFISVGTLEAARV